MSTHLASPSGKVRIRTQNPHCFLNSTCLQLERPKGYGRWYLLGCATLSLQPTLPLLCPASLTQPLTLSPFPVSLSSSPGFCVFCAYWPDWRGFTQMLRDGCAQELTFSLCSVPEHPWPPTGWSWVQTPSSRVSVHTTSGIRSAPKSCCVS